VGNLLRIEVVGTHKHSEYNHFYNLVKGYIYESSKTAVNDFESLSRRHIHDQPAALISRFVESDSGCEPMQYVIS